MNLDSGSFGAVIERATQGERDEAARFYNIPRAKQKR
jgi:hypothetical protein